MSLGLEQSFCALEEAVRSFQLCNPKFTQANRKKLALSKQENNSTQFDEKNCSKIGSASLKLE